LQDDGSDAVGHGAKVGRSVITEQCLLELFYPFKQVIIVKFNFEFLQHFIIFIFEFCLAVMLLLVVDVMDDGIQSRMGVGKSAKIALSLKFTGY
jgi:hypothetical protein